MERIVIIGNDRFSAELARACLARGIRTVSYVMSEASCKEFALLGHEVRRVALHEVDPGMDEVVVSPFVEERRGQTNWLWLSELATDEPNELVLGRLLQWPSAPVASDLAAWTAPVLFADFEGQIEILADLLRAVDVEQLKVQGALQTHSASAQDVAATARWLQAGNPRAPLHDVSPGPWKAWWSRHGFGLHAERPSEQGMPQAAWHVPGIQQANAVVFAHGYKGFSLWGAWAAWAQWWAAQGWKFHAVDFSFNGTTALWPRAIQDEGRWSRNTYFTEAQELAAWVGTLPSEGPLVLIGHSRGAVSTLFAAREAEARGRRLKAVVLLAPVAHPRDRFPTGAALDAWRESDRLEVRNARTGQVLVHPYRFYEDYLEHEDALDPIRNASALACPVLVFHASDDLAVSPNDGKDLAASAPNGRLHLLASGGHTMGTQEPWDSGEISPELKEITDIILRSLE